MSKKIKNLYIIIGFILSVFIAYFLWSKINLNYENSENVIGIYSLLNFSSFNNLLRYLFFTIFPVLIFILMINYFYKDNVEKINTLFIKDFSKRTSNHSAIFSLQATLIFFLFINIFLTDFSFQKIDTFHEGLSLSYGYNYKISKLFWGSSFIQNSLFSEFLHPQLSWLMSETISIGSIRVNHIFLRFITEFFLIWFIYEYIKILNFKKNFKVLSFLVSCIFLIYLNQKLTENFYPVRYRDIPIYIYLISLLKLITSNEKRFLFAFITGLISVFSILWSLDKGIYINFTLIFLLIFFYIRKEYSKLYFISFGFFLGWLIFYLLIGGEEFNLFLKNTYHIIKNQDLINGLVHPMPFDFDSNEHAARGTKNLLIIILNGVLISSIIFYKNKDIPYVTKAYLIFFYILAYINYKSGISRADSYHMKQSIFIHMIILMSLVLIFIDKILKKDIFFDKKLSYSLSIVCLILIFTYFNLNIKNFKNITQYKKNYMEYVKLNDNFFLNNDYKIIKEKLLKYNLKCVQLFTYDSALPYLLKKQSCTKYNFIYILSSETVQNNMIMELIDKRPRYIITYASNPYLKNYSGYKRMIGFKQSLSYDKLLFSPEDRFAIVSKYIKEKYKFKEKILKWEIYEIK